VCVLFEGDGVVGYIGGIYIGEEQLYIYNEKEIKFEQDIKSGNTNNNIKSRETQTRQQIFFLSF
jgi:hypothetical protein